MKNTGIILTVLFLCSQAASIDWQGAGTGGNTATDPSDPTTLWDVPGNWSGWVLPGPSDTASLNFTNAGTVHVGTDTVHAVNLVGSMSSSILSLSDNGQLNAQTVYVMAHFDHTGGTHTVGNLFVDRDTSQNALYSLSGSGELNVREYLRLGYSGAGRFVHTGGTANYQYLHIGTRPGCTGTYELSGNGEANGCIGSIGERGGTGTFAQSGGTFRIGNMSVGFGYDASGGEGFYELSGGDLLVAPSVGYPWGGFMRIGWETDGTFTQTGGRHEISDAFEMGVKPTGNGSYNLQGGELTSPIEHIGYEGTALFTHSAGTNNVTQLTIGPNGRYVYTGGTLNAGNLVIDGVFCGSGTIEAAHVENAGEILPGTSLGAIMIKGNYEQKETGSLLLEIGGYASGIEFDNLHVTGSATLLGTIDVSLIDGFAPARNDTFDVLLADNGITIGAGGLDLTGDPGFSWYLGSGDTVLTLEYQPIPEPTTMLLLGTSTLGLMAVLCGRRHASGR